MTVNCSVLDYAVAICCCLAESGYVILDPSKLEEQVIIFFSSNFEFVLVGLHCNGSAILVNQN